MSDAKVDMDGLSDSLPGTIARKVDQRTFQLGSQKVQELVIRGWRPGLDKLIWCLYPFIATTVNGAPNPLHHVDFLSDSRIAEGMARAVVEQSFTGRTSVRVAH